MSSAAVVIGALRVNIWTLTISKMKSSVYRFICAGKLLSILDTYNINRNFHKKWKRLVYNAGIRSKAADGIANRVDPGSALLLRRITPNIYNLYGIYVVY